MLELGLIGAKLLRFGSRLKEFFLRNWRWIVPLILVTTGFLWTKNHYYDLGASDERVIWVKRVADEATKNKVLTEKLAVSVDSFGAKAKKDDTKRSGKEVIHQDRIKTIIQDNPVYTQCKIDQEVLDEQNAIKALGPSL